MTYPVPSKKRARPDRNRYPLDMAGDLQFHRALCSWQYDEIDRLRTTLTGIQSCSTCEACRGAATLALGGATPEPAAERALRNCLLLAMSRLHRRSVDGVERLDWEHILRFCKEGGVEPSPLRASQPPGDGQCG